MTDTRQRLVTAGADLFRHQGYAGTGVKQIVTAAQAPFGSMYHHFPGGKEDSAPRHPLRRALRLLAEVVLDPAPTS